MVLFINLRPNYLELIVLSEHSVYMIQYTQYRFVESELKLEEIVAV